MISNGKQYLLLMSTTPMQLNELILPTFYDVALNYVPAHSNILSSFRTCVLNWCRNGDEEVQPHQPCADGGVTDAEIHGEGVPS